MLKEQRVGRMTLRIYETREEMGRAAAAEAASAVRRALGNKETANVIFAAAPSQNEVLSALASSGLDFGRVRAFHMDEYIGLPPGAPQRFSSYLAEHIFGRVEFGEIRYLDPDGNALEECRRYSELLKRYPPDVALMGIGENGHIAFNDPHAADFQDAELVKIVELDEQCRRQQVHDGCFEELSQVPRRAATLTIPALAQAKSIVCAVPGGTKRRAVTRTVLGEISEECPATILRLRGGILFCDAESGGELL